MRQRLATAAVLVTLLAAVPVGGQVADGGAPVAPASAAAPVDAGAAGVDGAGVDAGAPAEPTKAQESAAVTANKVATMMLATPTPVEEPPRPITRRLWFWMAVTGAIVAGVLIGIAVHNPNRTRPECPPDYVCPP